MNDILKKHPVSWRVLDPDSPHLVYSLNDEIVAMTCTPELAEFIVEAVNAYDGALEILRMSRESPIDLLAAVLRSDLDADRHVDQGPEEEKL